jgi:hypothetical protein
VRMGRTSLKPGLRASRISKGPDVSAAQAV